jgi:hypothetical protein
VIGLARIDFDNAELAARFEHHPFDILSFGFTIDAVLTQGFVEIRAGDFAAPAGVLIDGAMVDQ